MQIRQFKESDKDRMDHHITFFLKRLNEKCPKWTDDGICNGYAFVTFRADVLGELDKHIERLYMLANMKPKTIKKMAKVLLAYRTELFQFSQHKQYQDALHAQIVHLDKKTQQQEIALVRQIFFDAIHTNIIKKLNYSQRHLLIKAQELYYFVNMLLTSAFPDRLDLYTDHGWVKQSDFLDMLRLFSADSMLEAKSSSKQSISLPVRQVFNFAFVFTPQELLAFIQNKWGTVFKNGDFVQITSTDHTMYFSIKEDGYRFYDAIPVVLLSNTVEVIVQLLQEKFFTDFDVSSDYMPIALTIYAKISQAVDVRQDESTVLNAILKARGYDHVGQIKNINAVGWDGASSIYMAAYQDCPKLIKMLAAKGADVNKASYDGRTPVFIAAQHHNHECLDELAKYKADFNKFTQDITSVHYAVFYDACDVLQKLHEHGARFDLKDKNHETPLMFAMKEKAWMTAAFCLTCMVDKPLRKEWLPVHMGEDNLLQKLAKGSLEYLDRFVKDSDKKLVFLEMILHGKNALGKLLLAVNDKHHSFPAKFFHSSHPMRVIQGECERLRKVISSTHLKCPG